MRIQLGIRNRCTTGATASGGAWLTSLPAANVLTPDRALVARSANLATTSTRIDVDFGQLRALQAFALAAHNLSQTGTWRVTLGTSAGAADIWDSQAQAAWYLPWTGVQEWESDDWWSLPADEYRGHPYSAFIIAPVAYQARYMRVQITDTGNAAGYVQVGRLWASDLWRPALDATYGLEQGWADPSETTRASGGGVLAVRRRRYRTASMSWPVLSDDEAAAVHEIRRRTGTANELLYVRSAIDYQAQQRYGFIARCADMAPLRVESFRRSSHALSLEEWI